MREGCVVRFSHGNHHFTVSPQEKMLIAGGGHLSDQSQAGLDDGRIDTTAQPTIRGDVDQQILLGSVESKLFAFKFVHFSG